MVLHWWCNFMINHYIVCVRKGQTCASAGWFCQDGYFLIKWLLSSNNVLIWHVCASDLEMQFLIILTGKSFFLQPECFFFFSICLTSSDYWSSVLPPTFIHDYSNFEHPSGLWDTPGNQIGTYSVCVRPRLRSDRQQALQLSTIFCRWCRDARLIQGIWLPRWAVATRTPTFATWYCLLKENVIFINVILQVFLVRTIPFNECY